MADELKQAAARSAAVAAEAYKLSRGLAAQIPPQPEAGITRSELQRVINRGIAQMEATERLRGIARDAAALTKALLGGAARY